MKQIIIFFDLDGTLMDHDAAELAGVKAFHERHRDLFPADFPSFLQQWQDLGNKYLNQFFDNKMTHLGQRQVRVQELFAPAGVKLSDQDALEKFDFYLNHYQQNWRLYPDVLPCLDRLRGRRLGIISNGDPGVQEIKLRNLGIRDRFEQVVFSGEVGVSKPDPRIFLEACRRMGTTPGESWYIGDNPEADVRGSRAAGMKALWINRKGLDGGVEAHAQASDLTVLVEAIAGLRENTAT